MLRSVHARLAVLVVAVGVVTACGSRADEAERHAAMVEDLRSRLTAETSDALSAEQIDCIATALGARIDAVDYQSFLAEARSTRPSVDARLAVIDAFRECDVIPSLRAAERAALTGD